MIKEITIKNPITFEYPPDGSILPIIDPYDGCDINCPYCFQQFDSNWNKNILVKINIPSMINKKFDDFKKYRILYIGSKCDPYMKIETKYKLTRKCLIELQKLKKTIMLCTKGNIDLIERDIDIIKQFNDNFTLILGLSNLNNLLRYKNTDAIPGIKIANKFHRERINVWVFIAPILPMITDIEELVRHIPADMPIHLDKLRISKNSIQSERFLSYIKMHFPEYYSLYLNIINSDDDSYFKEIKNKYQDNNRYIFDFE